MRLAIALLAGAAAGLVAATQPVSDSDLFWHLATGREALAGGPVREDVFSWTVRGSPVSLDQWLGQVVLYLSYAALGWKGIVLVRVALVTALVALVVANAATRTGARPVASVLAALPAFVLTRAVWVDRPELAGFVLFALLLALLRRGRAGDDRALAVSVVVLALWANVHGSFALGAVLLCLVAAEGALRDGPRRVAYITAALAGLAATLLTPAGVGSWTAPGFHLLSPPREIEEWRAIDVTTPLGAFYVATLALVLVAAIRGPRPDLRELVIVLPVAALSLTAARHAPLLAIAAAPLLAASLEQALRQVARREPSTEGASRRAGALALVPVALLLALAAEIAPAAVDERAYPAGALAALPRGDGVLARYEWGGWLIWNAPATPVFVDGRLTPYLGGVLEDYHRIVRAEPDWREALARRRVRFLLVEPTDPVAVRARVLGWNEIATGSNFVLIAVP